MSGHCGMEDQIFRAMAVLHDQKQRHCIARLVGTKAPVTIVTPTIKRATREMTKTFLAQSYKSLQFAVSKEQAQKAIADRERSLSALSVASALEPMEIRRRLA
jgi:hypothetical protein